MKLYEKQYNETDSHNNDTFSLCGYINNTRYLSALTHSTIDKMKNNRKTISGVAKSPWGCLRRKCLLKNK
jgi:hypothetical protein